MFKAIDASTSGLVAQRVRMDTAAMNLANAESLSASGEPYQRRRVLFSAGRDARDKSGAGVHVSAVMKEPVFRWEYDPTHPFANKNGYVKMPGVDTMTETVNGMEAVRAYEANLAAVDASKAMLNSSLRLLA